MRDYHKIWVALILTWTAIYGVRTVFSPAIPDIMRDLSLNYALMGLASSAIFYAYLSTQFIAGFLGARFGRKRMLLYGTGITGIGAVLTSLAGGLYALVGYRVLTGFGQGLIFSNDRSIIAHSTPRKSVGLGQGLSFSGTGLGFVLGTSVGGLLVAMLGWRPSFQLIALSAAAAFMAVLFLVREPSSGNEEPEPALRTVRELLGNRDYVVLVLAGIPLHYNFWVLSTWLPTALVEAKMADITFASSITSLIGVAAPLGLISIGKLSDVAYSRGWGEWIVTTLMSILLTGMSALLTLEYVLRSDASLVATTVLLAGFAVWGAWAPFYRIASRLSSGPSSPIAFGFMNGVHFTGSLISPYLTGYLRDIYADFTAGLVIASLTPLITALLFLIPEPERRTG